MTDDGHIDIDHHPKLKQRQAIDKLADALPEPLLRGFRHGELRGTVLVLHFSHPAHLNEFKLRRDEILQRMREIYKEHGLRESIVFRDVRAEAQFVPQRQEQQPRTTAETYDEPAEGNFRNDIRSPELRKLFERIRVTIKERRKSESTKG